MKTQSLTSLCLTLINYTQQVQGDREEKIVCILDDDISHGTECLDKANIDIQLKPLSTNSFNFYINEVNSYVFLCSVAYQTELQIKPWRKITALRNNICIKNCAIDGDLKCDKRLNAESTSLTLRFEINSVESGQQRISCLLSSDEENGNISSVKLTKIVDVYSLPTQLSITPSLDATIMQVGDEYSFTCEVKDGHPKKVTLELISANNKMLNRAEGEHVAVLVIRLLKSHANGYLKCIDEAHSNQQNLSIVSPNINIVYIERNNKPEIEISMYKFDEEMHLKCSDYFNWKGRVEFSWIGIPANLLESTDGNEYNLKYHKTDPDTKVTLVCKATLHGNSYQTLYARLPVNFQDTLISTQDALITVGSVSIVLVVAVALVMLGWKVRAYRKIQQRMQAHVEIQRNRRYPTKSYSKRFTLRDGGNLSEIDSVESLKSKVKVGKTQKKGRLLTRAEETPMPSASAEEPLSEVHSEQSPRVAWNKLATLVSKSVGDMLPKDSRRKTIMSADIELVDEPQRHAADNIP